MQLITMKDINISFDDFIINSIEREDISGIFVNICKYNGNIFVTDSSTPILLTDFLNQYDFRNKRIILNTLCTTDFYLDVFAFDLAKILASYPHLYISVSSASNVILEHLKWLTYRIPLGKMVKNNSFDYADVDFYVFTPNVYDAPILSEQINRQHDVMLKLDNTAAVEIIRDDLLNSMQNKLLSYNQIDEFYLIMPLSLLYRY